MLIRLFALIIMFYIHPGIKAQNTWKSIAELPDDRYKAVAFSVGDFGYVGTGLLFDHLGNDFWKYDPSLDTWTEIDSMPTLGRRGCFSFAINNRGYVGGGVNQDGLTDGEFWEFDPELSKWSQKANLPKMFYSDGSLTGFAIGKKGYLLLSLYVPNFYMYNPLTNTWIPRAQFPGEGVLNQVGFSLNGKGYIGSGFGNFDDNSEFWEYDPITDQWSKKANVPGEPRTDAVGFTIDKFGYIGLGLAKGGVILDDFWEYHPETDAWVQIASSGFTSSSAVGMNIGSKGYVGTGRIYNSSPNFWEYTPNISSVNNIEQSPMVNIYPNPVLYRLRIDLKDPIIKPFSIYSVHGQFVKTGVSIDNSISVAELPSGVYFLKLPIANQSISIKFIKE